MKISVIIPTYNSERTIGECLRSLTKQTLPPHEIIVVDGDSTDSTVEKIEEFKNVKLILNTNRDTPGSARNKGADNSTGDIIYFCDSDCVASQRALEYYVRAYKSREDISGVIGGILSAGPGNAISKYVQKKILTNNWLGNLNPDGTIKLHFCAANFTIKKSIFISEKFREDLVSAEDCELFLRLNNTSRKIYFEPRAVVYHHHPTTIEQLFMQQLWYGEGIFQGYKIHADNFRIQWRIYSPARYISCLIEDLHQAVLNNNRILCEGCEFDSLQKCHIQVSQLMDNFTISDVNLHRLTCLAVATGILKQRMGQDGEDILREMSKWVKKE